MFWFVILRHLYMCKCVSPHQTGLCGNFNNIMSDDFRVISGLVEGTATAFANTWKTRASCPDITARFGHPCSQGISMGTARLSNPVYCHVISYHMKTYMNETIPYYTACHFKGIWCFVTTSSVFLYVSQRVMPSTGAPNSQIPRECLLLATLSLALTHTKM